MLNQPELILTVETQCRLSGGKKNDMLNRVTKRYDVLVELSKKALYESRMKEIDPSFNISERKWGKRIESGCMIEHKGSKYIECFIKELTTGVTYLLDGNTINKEDIIGFKETPRNDVGLVCYKVNNIRGMKLPPKLKFSLMGFVRKVINLFVK